MDHEPKYHIQEPGANATANVGPEGEPADREPVHYSTIPWRSRLYSLGCSATTARRNVGNRRLELVDLCAGAGVVHPYHLGAPGAVRVACEVGLCLLAEPRDD